jgi:hypothetical protein
VRRHGMARFGPWVLAAISVAAVLSCSGSRVYQNEQEALYAAEAGVEVGKMHLANVCKSTAAVAELRRRTANGEVPLPGYEQASNTILGQTIRGSVTVRLRSVEQEPTVWLVVSTGERSGTKQVVQARVTCPPDAGPAPR